MSFNRGFEWRAAWIAYWLAIAAILPVAAQTPDARGRPSGQEVGAVGLVPGRFVDTTEKSGVKFLHQAPHTSRKYLIETPERSVYSTPTSTDVMAPTSDMNLKVSCRT